MAMMAFDGQKSYINELLNRTETTLTNYTEKGLENLTCREADKVIDLAKQKLRAVRLKQALYYQR